MSDPERRRANGKSEVRTYEPMLFDEAPNGPSLVEIHVTETFSGDIVGDGVVRFLQAVSKDGSASFVGIERVRGAIVGVSPMHYVTRIRMYRASERMSSERLKRHMGVSPGASRPTRRPRGILTA